MLSGNVLSKVRFGLDDLLAQPALVQLLGAVHRLNVGLQSGLAAV